MPSLVRWKREGTVYIPGRECRRVGSKSPGPPSLSSSPLTSFSSHWPPHLNCHMAFHCLKTHQNSFFPNTRLHCVHWTQTESKMMAKGKMLHDTFALHNFNRKIICMTSFYTQTAQTEFPWCISRRKILGSWVYLTAKMAGLSIDHQWLKFKGKNCKELNASH